MNVLIPPVGCVPPRKLIGVGVTDPAHTDPLYDASVCPPIQRPVSHDVIARIVDRASALARTLARIMDVQEPPPELGLGFAVWRTHHTSPNASSAARPT